MKRFYFVLVSCFFSIAGSAQQCEWAQVYTPFSTQVKPQFIRTTSQGELLVAGTFRNNTYTHGTFLSKIDSSGNLLWTDTAIQKFKGCCAEPEAAMIVPGNPTIFAANFTDTTRFNGNIVAPGGNSNFFVAELAANGSVQNVQAWGNAWLEDLYMNASKEQFYFTTFTNSFNFFGHSFVASAKGSGLIAKVRNGQLVMHKQLHGNIYYSKVAELSNKDIVLAGRYTDSLTVDTNYYQNSYQDFLLIIDSTGMVKKFKEVSNYTFLLKNMWIDANDRIEIVSSDCWTPGCKPILDIYDTAITVLVHNMYAWCGYGSRHDFVGSTPAAGGGLWCWGHNFCDMNYGTPGNEWMNMQLTRLDQMGNVLQQDTFGYRSGGWAPDWTYKDITSDAYGHLYVTAQMTPNDTILIPPYTVINTHTEQALFVAKFGISQPVSLEEQNTRSIAIFPNPSTGKLSVEPKSNALDFIRIVNVLGQEVPYRRAGNILDLSNQSPGIYYLLVDKSRPHKIVIQR